MADDSHTPLAHRASPSDTVAGCRHEGKRLGRASRLPLDALHWPDAPRPGRPAAPRFPASPARSAAAPTEAEVCAASRTSSATSCRRASRALSTLRVKNSRCEIRDTEPQAADFPERLGVVERPYKQLFVLSHRAVPAPASGRPPPAVGERRRNFGRGRIALKAPGLLLSASAGRPVSSAAAIFSAAA